MGSVDRGDDRTFKVNFTGDGAAKLRETVKEKLKEFMGDYTDDTLVEYVIVLLRNGRRRDEARNELDVFLGDDSDSFVTWLWDHLSTSLHLYVQPEEADGHDVLEPKLSSDDRVGRNDSEKLDSEIESRKSSNLLRNRHNREWKGVIRDTADPPPLLSSEMEKSHPDEKPHIRTSRVKRSVSPQHQRQRKRSRSDDRHHVKREAGRQAIDAPRRLLQFAVRDAVATSRPDSTTETSLKRLRSVVATSDEDPMVDRPPRIRSVALVPNSMAMVIKAVAEAAEDVKKVKSSKSVFDRLGRGEGVAEPRFVECPEASIEEVFRGADQYLGETESAYLERHGEFEEDMTMMESDTILASDYVPDYEQYEATEIRAHDNVPRSDAFGGDDDDLIVSHQNKANNGNDVAKFRWNKEQHEPLVTRNAYHKMVHVPEIVSTRKLHPHYQAPKGVPAPQVHKPLLQSVAAVESSDDLAMQENVVPVPASNGNVKSVPDSQRTTQQSTTGLSARSMDDADSRTIFVNNVHVAATKDNVSQHFNKFGQILKVIINTDAATGQPIGSATIEFATKESADNALSLDGTFFMSRALKVMKRSPSAVQKSGPPVAMTWPRAIRGSPYARYPRMPFLHGIPGTFRARPPMRGVARSMQWKRDAQPTSSEAGTSASTSSSFNAATPFTARKFTYVRTEAKPGGNVGASAT